VSFPATGAAGGWRSGRRVGDRYEILSPISAGAMGAARFDVAR
jgi:hypothetical protein